MTPQEQADNERIAAWFVLHGDNTHWRLTSNPSEMSAAALDAGAMSEQIHRYDYFRDEAANAKLRDAMLDANCAIELCKIGTLIVAKLRMRGDVVGKVFPDKTAMRAIVGAFLKFMEANTK